MLTHPLQWPAAGAAAPGAERAVRVAPNRDGRPSADQRRRKHARPPGGYAPYDDAEIAAMIDAKQTLEGMAALTGRTAPGLRAHIQSVPWLRALYDARQRGYIPQALLGFDRLPRGPSEAPLVSSDPLARRAVAGRDPEARDPDAPHEMARTLEFSFGGPGRLIVEISAAACGAPAELRRAAAELRKMAESLRP